MERKIVTTRDGSHSISIAEMKVMYHSVHGAIRESQHVFIEAGLRPLMADESSQQISILEIGFGTGLNVLLSSIAAEHTGVMLYYEALEPFPLQEQEYLYLNYCELLGRNDLHPDFLNMHRCEWNKGIVAFDNVMLHKSNSNLFTFKTVTFFNLIYYDAFAPAAQPELWTSEVFEKLYGFLRDDGVLVTYCSKGEVRRAMQGVGFLVEKLPGPPGKREMIRAKKIRHQPRF